MLVLIVYHADQRLTSQVHEIVGRINGRFGTLTTVPIHHLVSIYFLFEPAYDQGRVGGIMHTQGHLGHRGILRVINELFPFEFYDIVCSIGNPFLGRWFAIKLNMKMPL